MFDRVIADFKCPYCGFKLKKAEMKKTLDKKDDAWQTKATSCMLDTYKIGDKLNFENGLKVNEGWIEIHHICPKCDKFVQAEIEIKNSGLSNNVRYVKR